MLHAITYLQFPSNCYGDIKGFVLIAYYLPMRQEEIINLTWEEIDFKHGFIRLGVNRTKNKTVRSIPMHPKIIAYFQNLPRPLKGGFVFSKRRFNRRAFDKAVEVSCLSDKSVLFHLDSTKIKRGY